MRRYSHEPTHCITDVNTEKELEVSFVFRGSNPMSKVILKKTADQPQLLEIPTMALKSIALAALMSSAAGVALAKGFTKEEELDAFLAKSDDDQLAELIEFAKAKGMTEEDCPPGAKDKMKKEVAENAPPGDIAAQIAKAIETSPLVKELQETNASLKKQVESLSSGVSTASLEKRAVTEFAGLAKTEAETVGLLKSISGLEKADREAIEGIFKSFCELTTKVSKTFQVVHLERQEGTATAQLHKLAKAMADADPKITFADAMTKVSEMPEHADLVEASDNEHLRAA